MDPVDRIPVLIIFSSLSTSCQLLSDVIQGEIRWHPGRQLAGACTRTFRPLSDTFSGRTAREKIGVKCCVSVDG
jgi:hypothetical protein